NAKGADDSNPAWFLSLVRFLMNIIHVRDWASGKPPDIIWIQCATTIKDADHASSALGWLRLRAVWHRSACRTAVLSARHPAHLRCQVHRLPRLLRLALPVEPGQCRGRASRREQGAGVRWRPYRGPGDFAPVS